MIQSVQTVQDTRNRKTQNISACSEYATSCNYDDKFKTDPRINSETSAGELVNILTSYPEFRKTAVIEENSDLFDTEFDTEEEHYHAEIEDDYYDTSRHDECVDSSMAENESCETGAVKIMKIRRIGRRPGSMQLEENATCIAIHEYNPDLTCKIFSLGYALFIQKLSGGYERRTVLWIPDCLKFEFQFNALKKGDKHLWADGNVELSNVAWTVALLLKGTAQLENIVHVTESQKLSAISEKQGNHKNNASAGAMSDNHNVRTEIVDEDSDGATHEENVFALQAHIDTPEMHYDRLESEKEFRKMSSKLRLLEKSFLCGQSYEDKRLYYMHHKNNLSVRKIATKLGIKNHSNVEYHLRTLYKYAQEYFFKMLLGTSAVSLKEQMKEKVEHKLFKSTGNNSRIRIKRKTSAHFTSKLVEMMKRIIAQNYSVMPSEVSEVSACSVSSGLFASSSATLPPVSQHFKLKEMLLSQFGFDFTAHLTIGTKRDLKDRLAEEIRKIPYRKSVKTAHSGKTAVLETDGSDGNTGISHQSRSRVENKEEKRKALLNFERAVFEAVLELLVSEKMVSKEVEEFSENADEANDKADFTKADAAKLLRKVGTQKTRELKKREEHQNRRGIFSRSSKSTLHLTALRTKIEQDLFVSSISVLPMPVKELLEELEQNVNRAIQNEIQCEIKRNLRSIFISWM